jgi:PKD repeat protein
MGSAAKIRLLLLLWVVQVSLTLAQPLGFVDEGVTTYPFIMSAVMVPNPKPGMNGKPMMIVSKKEGRLDVLVDPDISEVWTNILDIVPFVCENGPRGIQTIIADPDFIQNPYVYVYYTRFIKDCPTDAVTGPSNRLSRFTMDRNTLLINATSEVILLETPPSVNLIHDGGGLFIGNDNNIYLGTGDGGDTDHAQDLRNLWGKLIRITLNGTAPDDNPYTRSGTGKGVRCGNNRGVPPKNAPADAVCEEIFGYGLRNPFRFSEDIYSSKDEVRFNLCDVGAKLWEEISYGGTQFKGRNYGWPDTEGPCDRGSIDDCPVPTGNGIDPYYYYRHVSTKGASVVGAVHVPPNLWPAEYKTLLVEHSEGKLFNLIEDKSLECRDCTPPRPGYRNATFHSFNRIVEAFFGPYKNTQALYYVSREKVAFNVRRIYFTGSTNNVPKADITGLKALYLTGETVKFKGEESSDKDGDALTFLWDFGDGRTSTVMNPEKKYTNRGSYNVRLTVTDAKNQSDQDTATVIVGSRPSVKMESPRKNSEFKVGDVFRLKGSGFDFALNKSIVDPSQFFWEVRQYHETHYHPFLELKAGNDFDLFPAPAPEDFYAATNSYLKVFLTVYDADGVFRRTSRVINPKKLQINVESSPSGLRILLESVNVTTPSSVTVWENQVITIDAPDQGSYKFSSWSIGGSRTRTYLANQSQTITAFFTAR